MHPLSQKRSGYRGPNLILTTDKTSHLKQILRFNKEDLSVLPTMRRVVIYRFNFIPLLHDKEVEGNVTKEP